MSDPFIPLVPAARLAAEKSPPSVAVRILSNTSPDQPFQPITQALASRQGCPSAAPGGGAAAHGVAPKVTLKRDGDRVTHIVITCSCGEVIELNCAY